MLSAERFSFELTRLSARFGEPKKERRLVLQVSDFNRRDLDTRIRITDGHPILIQKLGDWNAEDRQEVSLALEPSPSSIARLYRMLGTMLRSDNVQRVVMQLENSLFITTESEIKLSRQFGKGEAYSFEVEQLAPTADLLGICRQLNLDPDLSHKDDRFWKDYSERVNLDATLLSEQELAALVSSYLPVAG